MKNYADLGGCYPPRPKALILRIFQKRNSLIALLFIQNNLFLV